MRKEFFIQDGVNQLVEIAASVVEVPVDSLLVTGPILVFSMIVTVWAVFGRLQSEQRSRDTVDEREILRSAIGASGAGFLAIDRWDTVVYAGPPLLKMLGLKAKPTALDHLVQPDGLSDLDLATLERQLTFLKRDGVPFIERFQIAAGRHIQVKGRRTAGTVRLGQIYVLSFRDVTELVGREARVAQETGALEARHHRLLALMSHAPLPIWLHGQDDMTLDFVNQAYVAAVGALDADEVLTKQIDLLGANGSRSVFDAARKAKAAERMVIERQFTVIDGHRRALTINAVPFEGGVAGFALDVTEREQIRNQLSQYFDSQSDLLNMLSTAVAIFSPDQRLRFFNSAFARLSQLDPAFLEAGPGHEELLQAMHESRRLPEQANLAAFKQARVQTFRELTDVLEESWHLPDGTTVRVVTQPEPMGGVMMGLEDVTSDLNLKRSYNTQMAVQRETLNNLREAVSVFGSDGHLKLFNPAFSDLLQVRRDHCRSEPHVSDLLEETRLLFEQPDRDWDLVKAEWLHLLLGREAHSGRHERADGRIVEWSVVPLPDGRTLASFADVTEEISYQRALRERNETLETADRLKTEFVANMSYELRTPLNSIIGFTGLLLDDRMAPRDAKSRDYLSYILDSAEQLRSLIDSILELALIEAGGMSLDLADFQIVELVDEVERHSGRKAESAQLSLIFECDRRKIGAMRGDRRRIAQALQNLIANAIKFTPPGGHITVTVQKVNDMVEFSVADDGIGIDADELSAIVQSYTGGVRDGSQSRAVGLGLPLVQSFVKLHGGTIHVESASDQGTVVVCCLPQRPPVSVTG